MALVTGTRIRNRSSILDHGDVKLRRVALDLAEEGLAALSPSAGLARAVAKDGETLFVGQRAYDLTRFDQVLLLGAGKASAELALALERLLGDRLTVGTVVVPPGPDVHAERLDVLVADHPLPTERSVAAAQALMRASDVAGPRTLVVAAFTGGSSALVSLPPPGISWREKRQVHQLLLSSGMSIVDVNTVRKHVSAIKGGRLARALAPATIVNLTVSDVVGDPLDCITDLTVQDTSTVEDAVTLLEHYDLLKRLPDSVQHHLFGPSAESPDVSDIDIESVIVTSGRDANDAIGSFGSSLGFTPVSLGNALEGEASTVGGVLGTLAAESRAHGTPWPGRSVLVACGGESTVSLGPTAGEQFGFGGPSQEAALGAALALRGVDGVAALFMDTDGSDGGGDVAGALVDASTAERADRSGLSLRRALARHDSTRVLGALGDTLHCGPTGTNANDLVVIVMQ